VANPGLHPGLDAPHWGFGRGDPRARHDTDYATITVMRDISKRRATLGWSSLTERERNLADRVAQGLTNRELAAQFYVSRYTIDAHLRQIYRKLSIRSRVDLTRLVTEQVLSVATQADRASRR
jgi:DNA-binding CsgD family transcriptional regulator